MTIYEAINKIMAEIGPIDKTKTNQQQGFKFRGIDDVMNVISPLLSKYGVFIIPEVIEMTREERHTQKGGTLLYSILKIKYTVFSSDGSSVSAIVVGEGMDSGDKASNKAMAIGMKYAIIQIFCVGTADLSDPDADSPDPGKKVVAFTGKTPAAPEHEKSIADEKRITELTVKFNEALPKIFPDPTRQAAIRGAFNEAKTADGKLSVFYRMQSRALIDGMDGPSRDQYETRYKTDKDMEKLFRDARAFCDKDTF
jgi:hypothetical protein